MHIRLTGLDGGDTRLTPDFLAGACIVRNEAATRSGVSTPAHTVIHDGGRYFIVRETPAEILAQMPADGAGDPTRPASIEEERLAVGWRQQIRGRDDIRPRDDDPTGDIDFKPADGGPGQWVLVSAAGVPQSYMYQTGVASVWVRWLVPVSP